jgi:hypothetical protein
LKLVAGKEQPDQGRITIGPSVELGYFAQHAMDLLEPESTVWQSLTQRFPHASVGSLRTLAGVFGFSGDDVEKPCRILSGGEKARLVLAQMLYRPPNFLVLDEPTNHLDLDTKEMLIEALADYPGTMLFVSHARAVEPRARDQPGRRAALRRWLLRIRGRNGSGSAGRTSLTFCGELRRCCATRADAQRDCCAIPREDWPVVGVFAPVAPHVRVGEAFAQTRGGCRLQGCDRA